MSRRSYQALNSCDFGDIVRINSDSKRKRAAFFDIDGTITKTNVVFAYFTHRIRELSFIGKLVWFPWFVLTCIFYLVVDSFDRAVFNRIFYSNYKGRPVSSKFQLSQLVFSKYYYPRIFPCATQLVEKLKSEGYKIVLVTGCLDFFVEPLARELGADHVYAAELVEENGRFNGKLKGMASSNSEKADRIQEYAKRHDILLSDCLAFGDSVADIPMLEAVGYPYVVNPSSRLKRIAEARGWPVFQWQINNSSPGRTRNDS